MKNRVKQGAASFYVIAFSTLVLMIVVASFTALVISQITRSENDELSQSAYDSALAGVEDAKLAFYNYQTCVAQGARAKQPAADKVGGYDCSEIVWMMENEGDDCDTVAKILGRNIIEGYGVAVTESDVNNNMQQAYTCVKLQNTLPNYKTTLSSSDPMKAVQVKLDDVPARNISSILVRWGSYLADADLNWSNYQNGQVTFPKYDSDSEMANPPTIALTLVQASSNFKLGGEFTQDSFVTSYGTETNKGTVYLVPTNRISEDDAKNYVKTTKENKASVVPESALIKSNDKTRQNLPYAVECGNDGGEEYACATMVRLPQPIDGGRSDDNFIVAVLLPYGNAANVELSFFCGEANCGREIVLNEEGEPVNASQQANLKGMQISVDSTGRANDLFRRVEVRLEGSSSHAMSIMGPLELFDSGVGNSNDTKTLFEKDYEVTQEWTF